MLCLYFLHNVSRPCLALNHGLVIAAPPLHWQFYASYRPNQAGSSPQRSPPSILSPSSPFSASDLFSWNELSGSAASPSSLPSSSTSSSCDPFSPHTWGSVILYRLADDSAVFRRINLDSTKEPYRTTIHTLDGGTLRRRLVVALVVLVPELLSLFAFYPIFTACSSLIEGNIRIDAAGHAPVFHAEAPSL